MEDEEPEDKIFNDLIIDDTEKDSPTLKKEQDLASRALGRQADSFSNQTGSPQSSKPNTFEESPPKVVRSIKF